jgi:hypothetical protein
MQTIDVHDLPEPVARAIEVMVQTIRTQTPRGSNPQDQSPPPQLPLWPGTVIGTLRRREIYEDEK